MNVTATRYATRLEIAVDGEPVDIIAGKSGMAKPFVAVSFGPVWIGFNEDTKESTFEDRWVATAHATADLAGEARSSDVHRGNANFAVVTVRDRVDEWCRSESCRYRNWRSGSMPTHRRTEDCPA